MRELDRLARDAKWSNKELAARLKVDPTMLMHIRAGRNMFSPALLGRISQVFNSPDVDALIVHHLRVERTARDATKLALPSDDVLLEQLDPAARRALRRFVLHFPRESVETGRGLFLTGPDATGLALAVQFLTTALQQQGIAVERLLANATPSGTQSRAGVAAALLIVERIEFTSAAVNDVLVRRSDVVKPIVVTSMRPMGEIEDAYLSRVFTSTLRPVSFAPAPTAVPHAE
jgi:transcriptional regulator with XRE-family HTH domain